MIVMGVRRCFIPSKIDGSDDSMLWNDSEEDENGSSKCKVETSDFDRYILWINYVELMIKCFFLADISY